MLHVEARYVNLLSYRLDNFKKTSDYTWNARCPVCGDSARKKRKARLYIYEREGRLLAYCHNCGLSMRFSRFLKEVDPDLYTEFAREDWLDRDTMRHAEARSEQPTLEQFAVDMTRIAMPDDVVEDLPGDHPAARFIADRLIPFGRVHYVDDFYGFAESCVPGRYASASMRERKEPRLLIPFADRDGSVIGFQGRSLDPEHPAKYVSVYIDRTRPFLYGLDRLGEGDVFALEGPIDAMMIPNAIASGGGAIVRELERAGIKDPVVVYDNEPRSPHTIAKMRRAAELDYRVCVWPRSLEHKDLNDMRRAGMSPDDVVRLVLASTKRGQAALADLALWSIA